MRARRVAVVLVAAVVGAVVVAPPAAADQTLEATGSITYTWQGDPSLGCAAVGVCDVQGALIVDAQGSVDLQQLRRQSMINLENGAATVRVIIGTGQSASECVDTVPNQGDVSVLVRPSVAGLVARITPALSSGRCAGPLPSDFTVVRLSARKSAGKHPSFDLRTNKTFAAGPFVGTLVSTVTMRPAPGSESGSSFSSSSGSSSGPRPVRHKVFIEHVRLRYRVTGRSEPLTVSFAGENDPFCAVLGSCGVSGNVGLSAPDFSATLTLEGSRQVRRRRDSAQVIADLERGRIQVFGAIPSVGLETSETLDWPDGSRCQDSAQNTASLTVGAFPPGRGPNVTLDELGNNEDLLRTHCPGPADSDVFGVSGILGVARGKTSAAQLLAPSTTVSLSDPGDFSGLGYLGSRSGAIGVTLTLEGVRAATSEVTR